MKSVTDSLLNMSSLISELLEKLQSFGNYFGYHKTLRRLFDLYKIKRRLTKIRSVRLVQCKSVLELT
jgi:hypothetical protein